MENIVVAKKLTKCYQVGETSFNALNDLSFEIVEGEFTVILGPSGAGKTTLLNIIGGMDSASKGELLIRGTNICNLNKRQLTHYRRNEVGFVFQFYNLMPNLTALENIELAVEMCKDALPPLEVLQKVGLQDRTHNFPAQLSGGEQQRVSIARAIAKNPQILLCDEPTGALDYMTGKSVLEVLQNTCREHKKTVIIVTHNSAIKDIADKVIYIKNGATENVVRNAKPKSVAEIEW